MYLFLIITAASRKLLIGCFINDIMWGRTDETSADTLSKASSLLQNFINIYWHLSLWRRVDQNHNQTQNQTGPGQVTSWRSPSLTGCFRRGNRWSSTPDRSPCIRTSSSSPPGSSSPDTPPHCRLPPCRGRCPPRRHSSKPRPRRMPDTPPQLNTWMGGCRTGRPAESGRSSLQFQRKYKHFSPETNLEREKNQVRWL